MGAHFTVFKGSARWRDWSFWAVIATYCALFLWSYCWGKSLWPILFWLPLYVLMLLPPRAWLGKNVLISMGNSWTSFGIHRFHHIESYCILNPQMSGFAENKGDIPITLRLRRREDFRNVSIYVQSGSSLDFFVRFMQERQVSDEREATPQVFVDLETLHSELDTFYSYIASPSTSEEQKREALYRFLGRAKPQAK